jgi:hypothetical protein
MSFWMQWRQRKRVDPMKLNTDFTRRRRQLFGRWLTTAKQNNRKEDGTYHGMTAEETKLIEEVLLDLEDFCHLDARERRALNDNTGK